MAKKKTAAPEIFTAKGAGDLYAALVAAAQSKLGDSNVVVDPKQTCIHLTAGKGGTAFAGIHPRKRAVLLNIRVTKPIKSPRVRKLEQVSAHRCHCEFLVASDDEVDAELLGWVAEAYDLAAL